MFREFTSLALDEMTVYYTRLFKAESDPHVRSYISCNSFGETLLNFITPSEKKIYNIHERVGIKLPARSR